MPKLNRKKLSILRRLLIVIFVLSFATFFVHQKPIRQTRAQGGNTYYVATNGNDSNPGTESQPWKTIRKAANTLTAGDTVLIKNGTYNEGVVVSRSGTADAYITYKAYPGHQPLVVAPGWTQRPFWVNGANYIEVNGLTLTDSESTIGIGIEFNNSHHGRILNCIARDNGESGISVKHSDHILIEGNTVFGNSRESGYQGSGISLWRPYCLI